MLKLSRSFRIINYIPTFLLTILPSISVAQQRSFTPEDALNVRTPSIQDMSTDGEKVAVTVQ